jgi:hypothetical protein
MRIKVRPSRLLVHLERDRFVSGPTLLSQDSFTFVRETSDPDLFEWIIVEASGKASEAVCASIGIALTRTILMRDDSISHETPLFEIAENQERGWTIIETTSAARAWESKLTALAPRAVECLTLERAGDLLRRTNYLRRVVKKYISILDLSVPLSFQISHFRKAHDAKLSGVARRLAWGVAVRQASDIAQRLAWVDSEDIYELAWLCIATNETTEEEEPMNFSHQNPNSNSDLMWRIHLIADWIMRHLDSPSK